jgi:hypothetical protein
MPWRCTVCARPPSQLAYVFLPIASGRLTNTHDRENRNPGADVVNPCCCISGGYQRKYVNLDPGDICSVVRQKLLLLFSASYLIVASVSSEREFLNVIKCNNRKMRTTEHRSLVYQTMSSKSLWAACDWGPSLIRTPGCQLGGWAPYVTEENRF